MSITLTENYSKVLASETVEFIDYLLEENYELTDILEFVDEHSEKDLISYYETYVEQGEKIGFDVVDSFIEYHGDVSYVEHVEDAYRGSYDSEVDFAEEFTTEIHGEIPSYFVVDWLATWNTNLSDDFVFVNGFVFRSDF